MPRFCILFYANYTILATQREAWPNAPLNTPLARGQGPGPRAQAQVFSKKRGHQNFFSGDLQKKKQKIPSQIFYEVSVVFQLNFNDSKIVLPSSEGQGNFRRLYISKPKAKDFIMCSRG